ncbi:MAG: hypothetical protein ABI415_04565 [Flavitalea sp.]
MKKIFLNTTIPDLKNAGSKAKADVAQILKKMGYESVYYPKFNSFAELTTFWKTLSKKIEKDSRIIMDYPYMPRKKLWILFAFAFLKRVKIHAVIHDITDLRFREAVQNSDMHLLKHFDGLISHNPTMTKWIREKGYKKPVVDLMVFDYCLDGDKAFNENHLSGRIKVLYAGNLSFAKASFLYDERLNQLNNIEFCVFGMSHDPERLAATKISYKGVFNPDSPELPEKYHFGLIWEGGSIETCTGEMGQYTKFNNPHKFSLYLALGLPIIAWKESAVGKYLEEHKLGVTIGSLLELEGIEKRITQEDYQRYISNIKTIGHKVRTGEFLQTAVQKLLTD